jgi:hypothetical protein
MSWTVACFCGNVYTAPPDDCEVCGRSIEAATPGPIEPRAPTFAHTPPSEEFALRFREAFPDLGFGATAGLIAEGDCVVGQWKGGGTHTGP